MSTFPEPLRTELPRPAELPPALCPISLQTSEEEIANSLTHGLGAVLSLMGLGYLLSTFGGGSSLLATWACAVYGTTMFLVYLASTLYHASPTGPRKRLFKKLDHACIFYFIAGSYTPYALLLPSRAWGWSGLAIIWALAFLGSAVKWFFGERYLIQSVAVYVAMGWLWVIALDPILTYYPPEAVVWMFLGGFSYTSGLAFLFRRDMRFHHTWWHVAVLLGSACHFLSVVIYTHALA